MLRFTAKGRIQVWDGSVLISSHVQEREAYERIAGLPPGRYTVTFPVIEVVSSGQFQSSYSTSSESGRVEARGMAVQVVRLLSDTTPPAVPSGFSATASTATTVTLTLTANVESDFSNYVLERSLDNIGWGYLKSFTGTSTTDTVDVNNSVYYYRAFALDTRGNRSAYTSVKSAGPYTAEFGWLANLFPVSIVRGSFVDLEPYINDPGGQLGNIVSVGTALPSGVAITASPTWRLTATSSATLGTTSGHQLQLVADTDSDWQSRLSQTTGLLASENFSTYANRAAFMARLNEVYILAGNQRGADNPYTNAPNGQTKFQDPVPSGEIERLGLSTSQYISGGKSAYARFIGGSGSGYQNGGTMWHFWFSDSGVQEVYLQWNVRFESAWLNHDHYAGTSEGRKILIMGEYDFANGETGMDLRKMIVPSTWRVRSTFSHFQNNWPDSAHPDSGTWTQRYAMMDRGSPDPVVTASDWYQRYGFEGGVGQDPTQSKYSGLGIPIFEADKWYTIMMYQNQSYISSQGERGCVKVWFSERGQAPLLLDGGLYQVDLNTGPIKSARLMIRTEGVNAVQPTTGGCYFDEVIAATGPIPWPGGHTVPYLGTTVPDNYPPATIAGVTEDQ